MINWNECFGHFIRSWRHHPFLQLGSLVVLTGTFTIIFSILLFFSNLERILASWGSNIEVNVFLKENLSEEQTSEVQKALVELDYFKEVKLITKSDATEKFFSKMSKYIPEFTKENEFLNIIPASFVGTLSDKIDLVDFKKLTKKIESTPGVEDLSYGQEWIENFSVFMNSLKDIGLAISLTLAFGALFIIGFTVYAVIVRRREEVEIYELFGATSRMIQAPFIFEGVLLSVLASVFAIIFSFFILSLQNEFFVSEMIYLGINDLFQFFSALDILILLTVSGIVGSMVSYFCIRKLNTGWSSTKQEFWS